MKYTTKQKRLTACMDGYQRRTGKSAVTTVEVANWMQRHGLIDVPKRGNSAEVCEAWEQRLQDAIDNQKG